MLSDRTFTAAWSGLLGAVARPQALLIFATLLWGGNIVASKALASDVESITISFWRWSLALLVLLPFSLGSLRQH